MLHSYVMDNVGLGNDKFQSPSINFKKNEEHSLSTSRSPISVSVLCAAFNHEKYIASALEGFVNQSVNFSYEVLVHDDASTDQTAHIIQEYAKRYPRLIKPILQSENQHSQGRAIVHDILFPLAKGKYIAICEGDDYWINTGKLQKQYDFMEAHPGFSLCLHNAIKVYGDFKLEELTEPVADDREKSIEQIITEGGGRINPSASFFFRKEMLTDYRRAHAPVGDHFMMIELASKGKVWWFAEPMSVYRYLSDGAWTSRNEFMTVDAIHSYCDSYIGALEWFDAYTSGRYSEAFQKRIAFQRDCAANDEAATLYLDGNLSLGQLFGRLPKMKAFRAIARKYGSANLYRKVSIMAARMRAFRSGLLVRG